MAPRVLHRVCYGNADPEPWKARLLTIKPAILYGFRRHKVRYADYPAIIPQANSTVRGTFVTGLTPGDISRLDYFEGSEYAKRKVKVRVLIKAEDCSEKEDLEGEEVETEVYVWIGREGDLEDGEWDFDEFVREKLALWA
jgi:Gamma-glutamyl cyclotransferase, AIG2-like